MSTHGSVAGIGIFAPTVSSLYTIAWDAQVGLGGEWTDDFTGTPAMQVGDATFNADDAYTVSLDRNETTRSVKVEVGNVTLNRRSRGLYAASRWSAP